MTLKAFAAQNGIDYNLAKQWHRRGKIVTEADSCRLATDSERRAVTVGRNPAGNRMLPVAPDSATAGEADVTAELRAGLTTVSDRLAALEIENETLLATQRRHDDLLADLNDRLARLESQMHPAIVLPAGRAPACAAVPVRIGRTGRSESADGDWGR